MGGTSISRMDNRSKYTIHHTADFGGNRRSKRMYPGQNHHFEDYKHNVTHDLIVYDGKGRLIKRLTFWSCRDNQWEISSWGVRLVKRWDHSNGVGEASRLSWKLDLEDHYNAEDRREEERRRQEEERRRREEEQRQREEEQRKREEEQRQREEEQRQREEEQRQREEEQRKREEEEQRRKEEEERQRQSNVDSKRTDEIAQRRYHEELEETEAINVKIGRQMEQRMLEQSLEQQKTIGWSTSDKVEIKGKMGDISIQPEEDISSEEDEKRIRKFLRLFYSIDKQDDKQTATLNTINQLKPTDLEKFPDKIILSIYQRLLTIPREKLVPNGDGDNLISELLLALWIELGVRTDDPDGLSTTFVAELFQKLPTLPSAEDNEETVIAAVSQALQAFSAESTSFPLNTFGIYIEKMYRYDKPPEELFQIISEIINAHPILITPKLADFVLTVDIGNTLVIPVILEKSEVKTEKMLKYLESFPATLPLEKCISHLCNYVDGDFHLDTDFLNKYLELLKDKANETVMQHLLLLVDAIVTGQYRMSLDEQRNELESVVSTILWNTSKDDLPLILKFAGSWYLQDKIGFIDPLFNGMMDLVNGEDGEYIDAVSGFFEDVAEKNIGLLHQIDINPEHLQMNRERELELKTKLVILDARLKAKVEVPQSIIDAILATFSTSSDNSTPPNFSYDYQSIYYCLQILLQVISTKPDFQADFLLPYLDHLEAPIRIVSFSVLVVMAETGQIAQEDIQKYMKFGKNAFQSWDSVENHRDAARFMILAIESMSGDGEEWEAFNKNIANFFLPSASAENKLVVQESLKTFQVWIDRAVQEGLFNDEYLENMCANLHSRLFQKLLTHLLSLKGHSLYPTSVTTLAEKIKDLQRFDEQELQDLANFLKDDEMDFELKEKFVMNVLSILLEKCLPILSVIEHVVECGNLEVVKVYAEAVSQLAVKHRLKEETMNKLFDMLDDPRFKVSVRKSVAKCLFYILRLNKELLEKNDKLGQSLIQVLNNANLRVYGLFAICHVSVLPEPVRDGILTALQNIHTQFMKMKKVALDEVSVEEQLNFKLSQFLLGRFGSRNESDENLQFNWMMEWNNLNKNDNLSFIFTDQSKHAHWLLKQNDPDLIYQGQKLSIELGIVKVDILLRSEKISEAESAIDKTLKFGESPKLLLLKADVFMAKSSFKGAIKLYRKSGINSNAEVSFKISRAYMALGECERAANFIPHSNTSEREICKKSQQLYDMLLSLSVPPSESKKQLKSFHAKTSRAFSPKEMLQMLEFMIEQKEHFDLSVIPAVSPSYWKVECVAREIFSRSLNKTKKSWTNFYYEFLEIQKLYRNADLFLCLTHILKLQRNEGRGVDDNMIMEILYLIKTVNVYENLTVQKGVEKSESIQDLLRQLRQFWIKHILSSNDLTTTEINLFFTVYENTKRRYPEISLSFMSVLLDLTMASNTLQDIADYLNFCRKEHVSFPEIQEFVGQLRLQAGTENVGINLKEYEKDFLKERLIKEILEMLNDADLQEDESMGMVVGEMISHYEDKICSADEVKAFIKFLLELDAKTRDEAIQNLLTALSVDKSYKNVDVRPKIIKLVKESIRGSEDWKSDLRDSCMGQLLHSVDDEKNVETLVKEYAETNDAHFSTAFENLSSFVISVNNAVQNSSTSGIHPDQPINTWNDEMVEEWASGIRQHFAALDGTESEDLKVESFAVIQHAMKTYKGYQLRQVGVMSLYILLSSKECGCLAKIATGEGKSGLVAALAVYKCLKGHTVDVITNSSVLAQRDCSEWTGYFAMFGLTAEENSGLQSEPNKPKVCYLKDIVYGDTSAFQGDVLRHEFSLLGTRGSRTFDTVIVDEVDSMFIDGSNHSTRLIDKMPQMDYVEPLFAAIWQLVGAISSTIVGIEGSSYAINSEVCGYSNNLVNCVVKAITAERLTLDKPCSNDGTLKQALGQFVSEMVKEELADAKFRRQVVNLLRQKEVWEMLPDKVQEEIKEMDLKELRENSSVVDRYIKEKWVLSDNVALRNALELYLKINILVYENVDNSLQLSQSFHADGSEENSKYPTLRFFKADSDLFLLNFVENDALYIARTVEKGIRKQFVSSYRTESYKRPDPAKNGAQPNVSKEPKLPFPGHIYELFTTKIDEWINSAIQAMFAMEENRNYVIKQGGGTNGETNTITPVDFENTGVTQESSVWGDGLHQFLQMKHKLKISPEYLATNFISNMSFFRRYKTSIYGLTGTLGDSNEVDLLKKLYTVQTINVPTFKPKRLLELDPVLGYDEIHWKNEILNSTAWEIGAGRVVLIICRTIEDVNEIKIYLEDKLKQACGFKDDIDFRLYYRSDDAKSEESIKGKMKNGTVVIATNLAGRGTNIKLTDEVVGAGGLHVIISFLPTNVRVEEQAAGRAARNGEPGTSQIILNLENETNFIQPGKEPSILLMKEERAQMEKARVDKIRDKLANELVIEEKQFAKFCRLKQGIQETREVSKHSPDFIMKGVGERWAVQLEVAKTRNDVVNWDKVDNDFDIFFKNLQVDYENQSAIQNPSYYILQGNLHLLSEKQERSKAIDLYNRAINRDKVFVQHAFYNRAHAVINQAGGDYKQHAISDLVEAANLINGEIIPMMCTMHGMVEGKELRKASANDANGDEVDSIETFKAAKGDTDFTKQMVQKINFNHLQIKSINEAIEKIQNSKRDVVAKFGDIQEFYSKNETEIDYADIEEMEDNGFIRFMYVEEKPFPWWDVLAVFILGVLQVVAGACLCLIGAANIGAGLVAEGVSDFVTGITACVTGEFSWTEYLKNKAISLGVSLLFAGAGVALKALSALPKVVSMVNAIKSFGTAVKNTTMVAKAIKVGQAIWSGLKSAGNFIWQGAKKGTNATWNAIKSGATSAYKAVLNSAPVKFITNSKPWIYAKNALSKAYHSVKDGVKFLCDKAKDFQNKIFGTKNLKPSTYSNLKTAGQIIGREILNTALFAGIEHGVLKAIGDSIEAKIKENVEAYMQTVFNQENEHGQKCRKLLSSCKGKELDVQIASELKSSAEEDGTPFGRKVYRSIVSATASQLFSLLKSDKLKNAKGWAALGAHLVDHLTSLVSRSVVIGETIKELNDALPLAVEELGELLSSMEQSIEQHDHATECGGENKPVDPRDMERAISSYCSIWATAIAKRMRGLIMSNLVQPQIKVSYDAAYGKLTKGRDFGNFLDEKAQSNRDNIVAKRPKLTKYFRAFDLPVEDSFKGITSGKKYPGKGKPRQPAGDNDPPPIPEPDPRPKQSIPGDTDPPPTPEMDRPQRTSKPKMPRGDSDIPEPEIEEILRFSSKSMDAAIDLFIETEGGLRYKETIGSSQNKDVAPVRIVSKTSEDGLQSFSRLTTGGSSNELQLLEFAVANEGEQKASLYAALTCESNVFESRKSFESNLEEFSAALKPRSVRSFKEEM